MSSSQSASPSASRASHASSSATGFLPRLRIAQVAPPLEAVPPPGYGGTERVVDELVMELDRRGHEVTLFASGDSQTPVRLIPTVDRALRPAGRLDDGPTFTIATLDLVLRHAADFDLIHSHLEFAGIVLARATATPVVNTFHTRIDADWAAQLLATAPPGMVAVSAAQSATAPAAHLPFVHNGLSLSGAPFGGRPGDALCFVGRMAPEKGAADAVRIAGLAGRRLLVATKDPANDAERSYHDDVFLPATRGADVELLGELSPRDRDQLFAGSFATVMPGDWPEPFGLVAIESMACGTPVVARRAGGLTEIVRDGVDGILGDSVEELAGRVEGLSRIDRKAVRAGVLERFSAARMADGYEAIYARRLGLA